MEYYSWLYRQYEAERDAEERTFARDHSFEEWVALGRRTIGLDTVDHPCYATHLQAG